MGRIAGMGALGLAIAAFDHFVGKSGQPQPATSAGFVGGTPAAAPTRASSAPPPPPPGTPYQQQQSDALTLIRAMIAAANADGVIDPDEQKAILDKLDEAGMNPEERNFIRNQLTSPMSIDSVIPQVDTPELARQVYAVSLLAIRVDTKAERDYLRYLQSRLGLEDEAVLELDQALDTGYPR